MKQARILIADDHNDFRKVVREYLCSLPNVLVVGEAVNGIDAIEKTRRLDPELVLMDISMPGCTGLEATRIIKDQWPLIKVVIMTMHDNPFYHTEAERAGADGYVLKPSIKESLPAIAGRLDLFLDGSSGGIRTAQEIKSFHLMDQM